MSRWQIVFNWLIDHGQPATRQQIAAATGLQPYMVSAVLNQRRDLFVRLGLAGKRVALWSAWEDDDEDHDL